MSDYREKTARPSTGDIGTPALYFRSDAAGDKAGADQEMCMGQLDPAGAVKVNTEGQNPTFVVPFSRIAVAATPTDIISLIGSATATIKVTRVEVDISNTTGPTHPHDVRLIERTTANTYSGATSLTIGGLDITNDNTAATAIAWSSVTNPTTLGTAGPVVRQALVSPISDGATANSVINIVWVFGDKGAKCPTLRGVAQSLHINGAGSTWGTAPLLSGTIEYIEVPTTV